VQSFDGDVVVLVSHGSFNPVHVDHLHMMVRARNVVHEQHTSAEAPDAPKKRHGRKLLVLGVFGITDESWLQRKGLAPEDCFSDDERVKMLELATAADDWLFVADATLSTKAPSAKVLIKMLQTQEVFPEKTKAKRKVRFIRVMGSDVCRRDDVKATTREVIVVDRDESIGHSSTQVRKSAPREELRILGQGCASICEGVPPLYYQRALKSVQRCGGRGHRRNKSGLCGARNILARMLTFRASRRTGFLCPRTLVVLLVGSSLLSPQSLLHMRAGHRGCSVDTAGCSAYMP